MLVLSTGGTPTAGLAGRRSDEPYTTFGTTAGVSQTVCGDTGVRAQIRRIQSKIITLHIAQACHRLFLLHRLNHSAERVEGCYWNRDQRIGKFVEIDSSN